MRQRLRRLFQVGDLRFERLQAVFRSLVAFLAQCFALDLELYEPPIDLVEFLGLRIDLHPQPRRRLVDEVDRLVRQEPVRDVAVRQRRRRDERAVRYPHAVVQLVFLLEAAQDRHRILDRGLIDEHRLEPPRQRRVLFDVLAVFIERGRAHAVQLAPRQRRLQQVRGIHRPVRLARPDKRVHFVDEQDDPPILGRHLVEHGLEPLLELAAILRTRDQAAHVERQQLLVLEAFRHVALDDAQREAFRDRGLADARFTDQHGIVLRAPREHLHRAPDFLITPDDGIELALRRCRRQVVRVALQRIVAFLRARGIGRPPLAQLVDRLVDPVRLNASLGKRLRRIAALLERDRQQQSFGRDVVVASLFRDLLRLVEDPREARFQIELPRATA